MCQHGERNGWLTPELSRAEGVGLNELLAVMRWLGEANMAKKLDAGQKHLLNLILKDADGNGWARVSKAVMPVIRAMPLELVEVESVGDDGAGRARLTDEGLDTVHAMAWL